MRNFAQSDARIVSRFVAMHNMSRSWVHTEYDRSARDMLFRDRSCAGGGRPAAGSHLEQEFEHATYSTIRNRVSVARVDDCIVVRARAGHREQRCPRFYTWCRDNRRHSRRWNDRGLNDRWRWDDRRHRVQEPATPARADSEPARPAILAHRAPHLRQPRPGSTRELAPRRLARELEPERSATARPPPPVSAASITGRPIRPNNTHSGAAGDVVTPGSGSATYPGVNVGEPMANANANANLGTKTTTQSGADNNWRYRFFDGRWWYWVPSNQWMYYQNGGWQLFNGPVQAAATGQNPYPYSTGYRGTMGAAQSNTNSSVNYGLGTPQSQLVQPGAAGTAGAAGTLNTEPGTTGTLTPGASAAGAGTIGAGTNTGTGAAGVGTNGSTTTGAGVQTGTPTTGSTGAGGPAGGTGGSVPVPTGPRVGNGDERQRRHVARSRFNPWLEIAEPPAATAATTPHKTAGDCPHFSAGHRPKVGRRSKIRGLSPSPRRF